MERSTTRSKNSWLGISNVTVCPLRAAPSRLVPLFNPSSTLDPMCSTALPRRAAPDSNRRKHARPDWPPASTFDFRRLPGRAERPRRRLRARMGHRNRRHSHPGAGSGSPCLHPETARRAFRGGLGRKNPYPVRRKHETRQCRRSARPGRHRRWPHRRRQLEQWRFSRNYPRRPGCLSISEEYRKEE